jgi:predicted SAM-dependent methyltransferase
MIKKLNFGCGLDIIRGWDNVDIIGAPGVNKSFNFNKMPYPIKDNTYDEILMKMILEHLDDPIKTLKEIIRISKDKSKLIVIVPHTFSYANKTDIQHKTDFTENSFENNLLREYELTQLELIKKCFIFKNKWKRFIPFKKYLKIFLNGIYDDLFFEFKIQK